MGGVVGPGTRARAGVHRGGALGLAAAVMAASLAGCASRAPVALRPEPVPYADTLPIEEPERRSVSEAGQLFQQALVAEAGRPFDVRDWLGASHEALNITRFDDVVGSAWWEPRNGYRPTTPEAVARGAPGVPPDTGGALRVVGGKAEGISPGFTVRDARRNRYLFKFDPKGHLHLASSADVISSRLFWAAGFNTPADFKVTFDSARLVLDSAATVETGEGERPMTRADVREILSLTDTLPDGRFVALASQFVPGTPKGPFLFSGVREDDPNDHYHHQYRRELRGLYVLAAWTNHVDLRFANTLDAYVEPGYLRHHLIDFAATLGSGTIRPHNPREGSEYNFDLWPTLARVVTLGFYREGWEGRNPASIFPSVGWMPVEGYSPGAWKANWPNSAFRAMTVRDAYWAAKLVAAFSDAEIEAAVGAGELPHPAASDTLVDILRYRRDRTVAHWYAKVTPLEEPAASWTAGDPGAGAGQGAATDGSATGRASAVLRVTFRDLGLEEELWTARETRYRWRFRHPGRGLERSGEVVATAGARQAVTVSLPAGDRDRAPAARAVAGASADGNAAPEAGRSADDALARLRVTARRPGAAGRAAVVHLRWMGGEEGYRVVGLEH